MGEDVFNVLELSEGECATDTISGDASSEEPRVCAKILDVEASEEGELEDRDEGAGAANKDAVVDVDGEDIREAGPSDGVDGGVDKGLGKAEGGEPRSEVSVSNTRSFADTRENLVELADETDAYGGRLVVALRLLHVDVRDDVGVE